MYFTHQVVELNLDPIGLANAAARIVRPSLPDDTVQTYLFGTHTFVQ